MKNEKDCLHKSKNIMVPSGFEGVYYSVCGEILCYKKEQQKVDLLKMLAKTPDSWEAVPN